MPLQTFDEYVPVAWQTVLLNSTPLGVNQAFVPQTNARLRVDQIVILNNDTIAHNVNFLLDLGTGGAYLVDATVPIGAGVGTVALYELISSKWPTGTTGIVLPALATLQIQLVETITAGAQVIVHGFGGQV